MNRRIIDAKRAFIRSLVHNMNEFVGSKNYTYDHNTNLIYLHNNDGSFYTYLTTAMYVALEQMDIEFTMVTLQCMTDVTQDYYTPIISYDKELKGITLNVMVNQSGFHYFDLSILIDLFTDIYDKVLERTNA